MTIPKTETNDGLTPAGLPKVEGVDAPAKTVDADSTKPSSVRELFLESEFRKAIAERDEAKKKIKDAEEKALIETNNFKKLFEDAKPELESLRNFRTEVEARVKAKLIELEKGLEADEKVEYEKFIAKLPESDRVDWITERLKIKSIQNPQSSSPGAGSRPAKGDKEISTAAFEAMSPLERAKHLSGGGTIAA